MDLDNIKSTRLNLSNLKTMTVSEIGQLQRFIDTAERGSSIVLSRELAINIKPIIITGLRADWSATGKVIKIN